MTSTLDDQNQKDIERIARYQKHKESGRTDIRDITFTEAAMVAVAPPAIVQVPGGKANLLNSGKSPITSNTSSAPCSTALASNVKNEPGLENSLSSIGSIKTNMKFSSIKRNEKSQTSVSSDSIRGGSPSFSSGASVTSVESTGTASTSATHRSQPSRKRAQPSEPSCEPSSDTEEQFLRPVPRHQLAKLSSQPIMDSTSRDLTHSTTSSNSSNLLQRPALSKKARSVLDAAAKKQIDWLSVAESAFDAGVLQPCQTQGAKMNQYHMCDRPVAAPSASELLAEHLQRSTIADSKEHTALLAEEKSSLHGTGSNTTSVESLSNNQTGSNSTNIVAADHDQNNAPPVGKKIVMTAKIDCVCSLELELNSNSVIVGIAVNYFR